jgi:exonuclease III
MNNKLKILTWNCNGALRKKFSQLISLDADILIIQECENPDLSSDHNYKDWAKNFIWVGDTKHKGMGVFVREGITLEPADLDCSPLKLFLPCYINEMPFLAVWTMQANSPTFRYIGQLWKFLQIHKEFIDNKQSIVAGDFNSNSIWDVWDRWWNHSDVVSELSKLGIRSVYHEINNIVQGKESHPTFHMYRKEDKPYHIDYIFIGREWNSDDIYIGNHKNWSQYSDHMPIMATISPRSE